MFGSARSGVAKANWFQQRRQRRRRRERMEEIIAWFVVPVIMFGLFWGSMHAWEMVKGTPILTIIAGDKAAP